MPTTITKPGPSKIRFVSYDNDGHTTHQCLRCKNYFDGCWMPDWENYDGPRWRFCPHCGIEWEGKHACREHGVPRYEYEHPNIDFSRPWTPKEPRWIVEERAIWRNSEPHEWEKSRSIYIRENDTAHEVYEAIKTERRVRSQHCDEFLHWEYRVRVLPSKPLPLP